MTQPSDLPALIAGLRAESQDSSDPNWDYPLLRQAADALEAALAVTEPFARMAAMYQVAPNDLPDAATLGFVPSASEERELRATIGDLHRARDWRNGIIKERT